MKSILPNIENFPEVDYAVHPAFEHEPKNNFGVDDRIVEVVEKIDSLVRESIAIYPSRIRSGTLEPFADEIAALVSGLNIDSEVKHSIFRALEATIVHLYGFVGYEGHRRTAIRNPGTSKKLLDHLANGFSESSVAKRDLKSLIEFTEAGLELLKDRSRVNPNVRQTFQYGKSDSIYGQVNQVVQKLELEDLVHKYNAADMAVDNVLLEYSHERSSWYKNCYSDFGIPTANTAYMHVDYEYNRHKTTIYLSDVDVKNGPFSYVVGSNTAERSEFRFAFFKELDQQFSKCFRLKKHNYYYRPIFCDSLLRRAWMSVPAPLRGTSHFGDDLLDDSLSSNTLLQAEHHVLGEAGSLVVFDGHRGIHRGGLVEKGERVVLHIGWGPKLSFKEKVGYKAKRAIRGWI